ncbi:MAG: single-stranded DNA-binding protein, partial [Fibrobacter sp.]|nr:single-stranded DNA-binding protein [Fibrobacter sp.]
MLNNVTLTGRLTKDADLKYTSTGTAVASFSLAVDRQFKNANGEKETDFINVVAWRKTAETLAEHTRKGSLIGIVGRIQTRNYEGN